MSTLKCFVKNPSFSQILNWTEKNHLVVQSVRIQIQFANYSPLNPIQNPLLTLIAIIWAWTFSRRPLLRIKMCSPTLHSILALCFHRQCRVICSADRKPLRAITQPIYLVWQPQNWHQFYLHEDEPQAAVNWRNRLKTVILPGNSRDESLNRAEQCDSVWTRH